MVRQQYFRIWWATDSLVLTGILVNVHMLEGADLPFLLNTVFPSLSLVFINVYTVTPDLRPVNDKVIQSLCHLKANKDMQQKTLKTLRTTHGNQANKP